MVSRMSFFVPRTDLQVFTDERDAFDSLWHACAVHDCFCLLYEVDAFLRDDLQFFRFLSELLGEFYFFLYPLVSAGEIPAYCGF